MSSPAANMSTPALPKFKSDLITSCLAQKVLTFGDFTLKSGRKSPYFFNAGMFSTAAALRTLSLAYASAIAASSLRPASFDVLFGPAYKGIPLCATTCVALAGADPGYEELGYAFNRKEKKDHGEGGSIVGMALAGKRVVIVDDVMSAGTAVREAVGIIEREGGKVVGVVVVLDRQEKVASQAEKEGRADDGSEGERLSTVETARRELGVPVVAVLTLDDLILAGKGQGVGDEQVAKMEEYRAKYGA